MTMNAAVCLHGQPANIVKARPNEGNLGNTSQSQKTCADSDSITDVHFWDGLLSGFSSGRARTEIKIGNKAAGAQRSE